MLFLRTFFVGIGMSLLFIYLSLGLEIDLLPYAYIYVLIINMIMVIASRKSPQMFITTFIILFCNYSFIYGMYINLTDDKFITILSAKSHIISLNLVVMLNVLWFIFFKWSPSYVRSLSFNNTFYLQRGRSSKVLFYGLLLILLFIFLFGYSAPEIEGGRGASSPLYEYSVIIFILLFHFYGNKSLYRKVGMILIVLFCLKSFLWGGRVEGIQIALCAYIMLFSHKVSMKILICVLIGAFFLMTLIGSVRGAVLSGNYDLYSIFQWIVEHGFASDTAIYAFYASESYIYALDRLPPDDINSSFYNFIKSIFIGGDNDLMIQELSQRYVHNQGGCMLPFVFYCYMGRFGVVLISLITILYFKIINGNIGKSSDYLKCLTVWIVCTTFRWYLYYPLTLLRGVLFMTIAYFLASFANKCFNRVSFSRKASQIKSK